MLFAVNVYRAVTQSITYDEAGTYLYFVSGTWGDALTRFNTHVLYSVLANLTTRVFGPSEFALRLPTVAAGALYLGVGFLLCRQVLGAGLLFVAALGAIALNPFVLDFLSVARGYGLALALLLLALYQILRALGLPAGAAARYWITGGVALGFSVAANLAFAFPATALGLTAVVVALLMGAPTESGKAALARQVGGFCGAALLSAAAILAVPLSYARREDFSFGADTLGETVSSLVWASLRHHRSFVPIDSESGVVTVIGRLLSASWVPTLAVALLFVALGIRRLRDRSQARVSRVELFLVLSSGTLVLTFALLVAAHELFGIRYPFRRTGIYLIPLGGLFLGGVARRLGPDGKIRRILAGALTALLLGALANGLAQFNVSFYTTWRFDAGAKRNFDRIARCAADPAALSLPLRVGVEPELLAPSLEYYRLTRDATWMAPIDDPWNERLEYDVFLVRSEDASGRVSTVGESIAVDEVSGVWMLVHRSAPRTLASCLRRQ